MHERIATLEAHDEALHEKVDKMQGDLELIKENQAKQKGYINGAASVLTVFWALIGFVLSSVWDKIFNGDIG